MADPHATLAAGRQFGVYPLPYVPGMPLTSFDPNLAHEYRDSVDEIRSLPKAFRPVFRRQRQLGGRDLFLHGSTTATRAWTC